MQKILIIEDDEKLRKELEIFLNKNGYETKTLNKFDNVIEEILNGQFNLILLDINLPYLDGQYICKEIRKESNIPIIIITSRNNEIDELISINYGADDFISKPFNTQILLARISSILKRLNKETKNQNEINCSNFKLNLSKSTIEVNENEKELTKNELKILHLLVLNKNQIVSRDEIMTYLWDSQMYVDDNTLTVNITRLRNKLEDIGLKDIIETKRGQGYILKEEIQ